VNALTELQALMQALGPSTVAIEWLVQESTVSWTIGMVSGHELGISFCDSPDRILLSAMIGTPDVSEREATYTAMLCSNLLYAEERALRVALTGPEGDLMLISECTPDEWTAAALEQCILCFSDTLSRFIDVVSTEELAPPANEPAPTHRLRA
jgi:hypothetical protein